jgi:hypothetical protein
VLKFYKGKYLKGFVKLLEMMIEVTLGEDPIYRVWKNKFLSGTVFLFAKDKKLNANDS